MTKNRPIRTRVPWYYVYQYGYTKNGWLDNYGNDTRTTSRYGDFKNEWTKDYEKGAASTLSYGYFSNGWSKKYVTDRTKQTHRKLVTTNAPYSDTDIPVRNVTSRYYASSKATTKRTDGDISTKY